MNDRLSDNAHAGPKSLPRVIITNPTDGPSKPSEENASTEETPPEKPPTPRSVNLAVVLIICCISITAYWAGDITKALKTAEMNISNAQFSLLEASEDFMSTILLLPFEIVTDRLGGAVILVYGKALYTFGTILVAAAVTVRSYKFMIVGRIVAALGNVSTEMAEYKMFSSWFAPSQGFAFLVALRQASAKAGAFIGKGTANTIAEDRGLEWVFRVAVFVNLFGNISTIAFWIINRYCEQHYEDPKDMATQENLRKAKFEFRKLKDLPWMYWSIMGFALFEASTSVTFSQNATELAEMRFHVDPVAAGWYAAVSQNGGLFFVPLLGMFLDRFGHRASASTAASYVTYGVVRTMALTCTVDGIRMTIWEEGIFATALACKEIMNSTANLIVRVITGVIQDADDNSYDRVMKGYLTLSAGFFAVSLAIFLTALVNPNLRPLQWSRQERFAKGPTYLARIRNLSLLRLGQDTKRSFRRVWSGFVNFAARDNVLEVALGLIIAKAFTKVVTSFVADVVLPIVSLLPFLNRNLDQKFAVLSEGPNFVEGKGYNTLDQARSDGALVLAYGVFLETIISFFGVSLTLYAVAQLYMYISHDTIIKPTVRCKYCRKFIGKRALRCIYCSSWQDGREDLEQLG
ncbi:hypothetical protein FE257_011320 [Aspergillus nanangensis]|uniref:Major facilitator superfamily (MFS) profile domain-containing protein n=1 Tax=Aspergillus nanangensis TaxID=2582783 RepID=A0AAD4CIU7_ASPNN|nr:hypothetical protein FE257_011320 [Aspergillus nanangensis]